MLFVVFVSAVLALSAPAVQGQVFSWGRCPNVPVAQNFQLDRWLGTYIEIARTPNSMEENMHCVTETRLQADGDLKMKSPKGVRDGIAIDLETILLRVVEPGKLSVPYFSQSFLPELPLWILEWNDDPQTGYYVGFTCYDIWVGNMQLVWIMSKERQMDEVKLNGILGRLEGYDIDTSRLEYVRQDDSCPALP